jgi:hypothetical protein
MTIKTKKKKKITDMYDAQHPYRQSAITIIEEVIEPMLGRGINGTKYYDLEDKLVRIINDNINQS